MSLKNPRGYSGKILRVDLTSEEIREEKPDELTLRQFIGGTGLGIKYLYDEVSPKTQWHEPENRFICASGPVGGTRLGGSGIFSVVTKGALTNGATSVQANGFFGAFLKLAGFDGVIVQGAAKRPVYLYIHNNRAEIKDAAHLAGKDTWQTEELIKEELIKETENKTKRGLSVYSIGPAGENLVRFACLVGDSGHVAAHNGPGAVMGSKKLKAFAVSRGDGSVEVADKERLSFLAKDLFKKVAGSPNAMGYRIYKFGTTGNIEACKGRLAAATLPVKNYTTSYFPKHVEFSREYIDPLFDIKSSPCWACRFKNHCRILKVKTGPYAGYTGEEPEYEQWAHWGPNIGQKDQITAFVLSNEVDRLGMDTNHVGWLISWLMECYEKELISSDELDGIELNWGNAEGVLAMLRKIALRQGVGDILAEGIQSAVKHFSPEAGGLAIYTKKGNTPRAHDHRVAWRMILDTCISDTGSDEAGSITAKLSDVGLPGDADLFSSEVTAKLIAGTINRMPLDDSLPMCRFNNRGAGVDMDYLAEILKAVTGFDFTGEELKDTGYRIVNLLRAFNIRHGLTTDLDMPSVRYSSAPIDGPFQGITIGSVWPEVLENYYRSMGWDVDTGTPLPKTLKRLGLEYVIKDIW